MQQTVRVKKDVDQMFLIQLTNQDYESILVIHTGEEDKEPSSVNASLIERSPAMRWSLVSLTVDSTVCVTSCARPITLQQTVVLEITEKSKL